MSPSFAEKNEAFSKKNYQIWLELERCFIFILWKSCVKISHNKSEIPSDFLSKIVQELLLSVELASVKNT